MVPTPRLPSSSARSPAIIWRISLHLAASCCISLAIIWRSSSCFEMQRWRIVFAPPFFGLSLQNLHSLQSSTLASAWRIAALTTTGTRSFRLRWLLERWLLERWLLERQPLLGPSAVPARRFEGEGS
jgi:hypothetical protein